MCYSDSASATATSHYIAGRVGVMDYISLGSKYGYGTSVVLYNVDGSWTDSPDCL